MSCIVFPFFQISGLKQGAYQSQKSIIVELFCQYCDERVMMDGIEATGYISLDKPPCSFPCRLYSVKCCMTTSVRSETVRKGAELRFIICIQNRAYNLLE